MLESGKYGTQSCVEVRLVFVGRLLPATQRGGTVCLKINFKDPKWPKLITSPLLRRALSPVKRRRVNTPQSIYQANQSRRGGRGAEPQVNLMNQADSEKTGVCNGSLKSGSLLVKLPQSLPACGCIRKLGARLCDAPTEGSCASAVMKPRRP